MKITTADSRSIDIRLTETVTTGAGSIGDRSGIRIHVATDNGLVGIGETAPIPGVNGPRLESIAFEIDQWAAEAPTMEVEQALETLDEARLSPLARFAVHTALVDLQCLDAEVPLSQWLRAGAASEVFVNGLVSEAAPGAVHAHVSQLVAEGVRAVKLKVGASDPSQDVTRIIAASEAAGAGVQLRLDANGAWDVETAQRVIGRVGKHRITYLEDPTNDPATFRSLEEDLGVAIALDVPLGTDPLEVVASAEVGTIVVKPAAVGGVDRVLDIARAEPDLNVIVSSSIDREVALSAAIHAAAALPGQPQSHGLATGALIRNMAASLIPARGVLSVSSQAGVWSVRDA